MRLKAQEAAEAQAQERSFNSKLVRLKDATLLAEWKAIEGFNSKLVRLKACLTGLAISAWFYVSIPNWCD